VDAPRHAVPLLEALIRSGLRLRFHTPNALHIRGITPSLAGLLARSGFRTVRLGLETALRRGGDAHDRKVDPEEFLSAAHSLRKAGFSAREVGAYLMIGLPGQLPESVVASIHLVKAQGIRPILAYFTPIPHTRLWADAVAVSPYDLEADPVFCNNAIFPCQPETFSWKKLSRLKEMTRMAA
jgi:radical SAM superfamily enzyme YgiQ (UPF0313 family)